MALIKRMRKLERAPHRSPLRPKGRKGQPSWAVPFPAARIRGTPRLRPSMSPADPPLPASAKCLRVPLRCQPPSRRRLRRRVCLVASDLHPLGGSLFDLLPGLLGRLFIKIRVSGFRIRGYLPGFTARQKKNKTSSSAATSSSDRCFSAFSFNHG